MRLSERLVEVNDHYNTRFHGYAQQSGIADPNGDTYDRTNVILPQPGFREYSELDSPSIWLSQAQPRLVLFPR
jgi:hypothetical protein